MSDRGTVTRLLLEWSDGSETALDRLIPLVYEELRGIAARQMAREGRAKVLLQPTALIHEAWLALVNVESAPASRSHFFALATAIMRHVLVNYARNGARQKRGGGSTPLTLDDARVIRQAISVGEDVLLLEVVLERFRARDPKRAQVFDLYFYGQLTIAQIAAELERPIATVGRQLTFAKAWVRNELGAS